MASKKGFAAQFKRNPKERQPPKADSAARVPLTSRFATVDEAPLFDKKRVFRLRDRLGFSQPVFAAALNVSPETIKSWEQGKRVPEGAALRLLQLTEERPEWIMLAVRSTSGSRASASLDQIDDLSGSR